MFIIALPQDGIKETPVLNRVSKSFRNSSIYKAMSEYIQDGFDINIHDCKWEYTIRFNNSLIVYKEYDDYLDCFIYLKENDILPAYTCVMMIEKDNHKMNNNFCKSMNNIINKLYFH